jgi:anti-anti-sigma factor
MKPDLQLAIAYGRRGDNNVRLEGELDIASLSRVRRVLHALLEESARLAVDLGDLRFVDLAGMRLLSELGAAAAALGCPFELHGASGQVARLLELTRPLPAAA